MQESTGRESSKKEDESNQDATKSGATSDATLSDLEENQADVDSSGSKPDPGPSPDGTSDESDEIKDAGPM